jgi:hypothetical protein
MLLLLMVVRDTSKDLSIRCTISRNLTFTPVSSFPQGARVHMELVASIRKLGTCCYLFPCSEDRAMVVVRVSSSLSLLVEL